MTKKILSIILIGRCDAVDSMRPPGITGDGRLFRAGISRHPVKFAPDQYAGYSEPGSR